MPCNDYPSWSTSDIAGFSYGKIELATMPSGEPKLHEKVRQRFSALRGNLLPYLDAYGDETPEIRAAYPRMFSREPTLRAATLAKVLSVAKLTLQVHPGTDDAKGKEIADFVRHLYKRVHGDHTRVIVSTLLPGVVMGHSVCEKVWGVEKEGKYRGAWVLRDIKPKDTRLIQLLTDAYNNLTGVRALGPNNLRTFDPDAFTHFSHVSLFDSPLGIADYRACYRAYQCKDTLTRLRAIGLQRWGGPYAKGTYDPNFPNLRDELEAALSSLNQQTYIILPKGAEVDLVAAATGGNSEYTATIQQLDQEMVVAVAGAYLQILGGNVDRGDTEVHQAVSELFPWFLSKCWCSIQNEQVIPEAVGYNYLNVETMPYVTLESISDKNLLTSAQLTKALQDLGLKIGAKATYAKYGIDEPADEADVLKPASQQQQGGAGGMGGMMGGGGPGGNGGGGGGNGLPFAEDKLGHEHKGKGEGGGEFTKKGGGGSSGHSSEHHARIDEKIKEKLTEWKMDHKDAKWVDANEVAKETGLDKKDVEASLLRISEDAKKNPGKPVEPVSKPKAARAKKPAPAAPEPAPKAEPASKPSAPISSNAPQSVVSKTPAALGSIFEEAHALADKHHDGLSSTDALYDVLKRDMLPDLTTDQYKGLLRHLASKQLVNLDVVNEVRKLTPEQRSKMPIDDDPKRGYSIYAFVYWRPDKSSQEAIGKEIKDYFEKASTGPEVPASSPFRGTEWEGYVSG